MPPVRTPDAVNLPAELFQDSLPGAVAGSRNERTVVSRAVTFNSENVFAALFDYDVEPEFASTVLTFDVIPFVFQKLDDLFLKGRLAINDI
jgi:hypothetical protein